MQHVYNAVKGCRGNIVERRFMQLNQMNNA